MHLPTLKHLPKTFSACSGQICYKLPQMLCKQCRYQWDLCHTALSHQQSLGLLPFTPLVMKCWAIANLQGCMGCKAHVLGSPCIQMQLLQCSYFCILCCRTWWCGARALGGRKACLSQMSPCKRLHFFIKDSIVWVLHLVVCPLVVRYSVLLSCTFAFQNSTCHGQSVNL